MAGETTPLLLPDPHKQGAGSRWRELRILAGLSFPLFLMNYLRFFIQACGVFSVAQLGTVELAASSLGMMTVNAFGIALLVGFIGGSLNTLANQAATSQNQQLASVYCIRTFIISMQITPLLMILLCATGPLFRALLPNADAEMIKLASNYCSIASLALPPLALSECIRRYCQAFGKVAGPAIGYTIAAPVAIALNYFLIISPSSMRLGVAGAAVALVVSNLLLCIIIAVYALVVMPRHTWAGFTRASLHNHGQIWRFGSAGVVSTISETYAFEAMNLGSVLLGQISQATTAICMLLVSLVWQTPLALTMALSIRIGNLCGALEEAAAKRAAQTAQLASLLLVAGLSCLVSLFGDSFAGLLTREPAVLASSARCMKIVALIALVDGMQGAGTGILQGQGRPDVAAQANLLSYWAMWLPIGALMTWWKQDVLILWLSLFFAVASAAAMMHARILRTDWTDVIREARIRAERDTLDAHHSEEAVRSGTAV